MRNSPLEPNTKVRLEFPFESLTVMRAGAHRESWTHDTGGSRRTTAMLMATRELAHAWPKVNINVGMTHVPQHVGCGLRSD